MSLLPILLEELERYRRPAFGSLYDQNFGLGLLHDDMLRPSTTFLSVPLRSGYMRPWRVVDADHSGVSNLVSDKQGFKVNLDVQQFKPEELKVKIVDDYLVVEAKHEERSDQHGFVSRQFTRRYKLPEDVDASAIASKLSSDGVLSLEAPKKVLSNAKTVEIPILHTNQPAIRESEPGKNEQPGVNEA